LVDEGGAAAAAAVVETEETGGLSFPPLLEPIGLLLILRTMHDHSMSAGVY